MNTYKYLSFLPGIIKTSLGLVLCAFLISSCENCNNCGPVTDDPYFTVQFMSRDDKKPAPVIISSINGKPAQELSLAFQKRESTFKLPLSPNEDIASFQMEFTEYSASIEDTLQYSVHIQATYSREEFESNGFIKLRANNLQVITSIDSIAPTSFDQSKFSNELKLQLFL